MASNVSSKENDLQQDLRDPCFCCNICNGILKDPRILNCLHSFCMNCLKARQKDVSQDRDIICPLCHSKTSLPAENLESLPCNYFVQHSLMIEHLLQGDADDLTCSFCTLTQRKSKATSFCLTCGDLLCEECSRNHTLTRLTFDHRVCYIKDQDLSKHRNVFRNIQGISCPVHPDEKMKYFCVECNELVCFSCVFANHKNHQLGDIAECATDVKTKLREYERQCTDSQQKMQDCVKTLNDKLENMKSSEERITTKLESQRDKHIQNIMNQYSEAKMKINSLFEKPRVRVQEVVKGIERNMAVIEYPLDLSKKICDNAQDIEIMSISDTLLSTMENMSKVENKMVSCVPDIDTPVISCEFSNVDTKLFRISVSNDGDVAKIRSNTSDLQMQKQINPGLNLSIPINVGLHTNTDFGEEKENSQEKRKSFCVILSLPNSYIRDVTRTYNGNLVVADIKVNLLKTYTYDGHLLISTKTNGFTSFAVAGNSLICCVKEQIIILKDESTGTISTFLKGDGGALVVAKSFSQHSFYIGRLNSDKLWQYSKEGSLEKVILLTRFVTPKCMVVDSLKNIFILERSGNGVCKVNKKVKLNFSFQDQITIPNSAQLACVSPVMISYV